MRVTGIDHERLLSIDITRLWFSEGTPKERNAVEINGDVFDPAWETGLPINAVTIKQNVDVEIGDVVTFLVK